jgi:hypothetical protein
MVLGVRAFLNVVCEIDNVCKMGYAHTIEGLLPSLYDLLGSVNLARVGV